ncbi:MAG: phosphoribosylformylglycinamidine cyclo-ligase, partial [Candidatus Cloacimonetes bacterium]|nr:phosphoribosylformylglycinamidine cyclo-ligase [Candidatus Cloacimonadota bacterium]
MTEKKTASVDYKQAGVDIAAGEQAVKNIKDRVRTTYNKNVLSELG